MSFIFIIYQKRIYTTMKAARVIKTDTFDNPNQKTQHKNKSPVEL